MKIDVVTFGSATRDIFLRADSQIFKSDDFSTGEGVCFPLGSKVNVNDLFFTTGGGGTNTAVTFTRQGFKTAYIGRIGKDSAGDEILKVLKNKGVITEFVKKSGKNRTNFSVVLSVEDKDRTILVYRGASGEVKMEDIPEKMEADWFYISPFSKEAVDAFYEIVEKGKKMNVNLAVNPSKSQLEDEQFIEKINEIDILIVNKEEAAILTDIDYRKEEEIFQKIDQLFRGIFVMTKGPQGLTVSDDEKIYKVNSTPEEKVIDRTGAGDSFGSGFVSALIQKKSIEEAIQLGVSNATGCLTAKGAKNGLLAKGEKYQEVPIKITKK